MNKKKYNEILIINMYRCLSPEDKKKALKYFRGLTNQGHYDVLPVQKEKQ